MATPQDINGNFGRGWGCRHDAQ